MDRQRTRITGIKFPVLFVLLLVWLGTGILIYHIDVLRSLLNIHKINKLAVGIHNDVSLTIPQSDVFIFLAIFVATCTGLIILNSTCRTNKTLEIFRNICTVPIVIIPVVIVFCVVSSKILAFVSSELQNPNFKALDSLINLSLCFVYLILALITSILDIVLFRILHLHIVITYLYYPIITLLTLNAVLLIPEVFIVGVSTTPSKLYSSFIYALGFIINFFYPISSTTESSAQSPMENRIKENETLTNSKIKNVTVTLPLSTGERMSKESKNIETQNIPEPTEPKTAASLSPIRSVESGNAMTTVQKLNDYLQRYMSNSGTGILGRFFHSARMKYAVQKETEQANQQAEFYEAQAKKTTAAMSLVDATMRLESKHQEYHRNKQQQEILNNRSEEDLEISKALHNDSDLRQQKIDTAKMNLENETLKAKKENIKLKTEIEEFKNLNQQWKPPIAYATEWQQAQDEAKVAIREELEKHILQKLREESDLQQVRKEGRRYILSQQNKTPDEQDYLLDLLDELIDQNKERKKIKEKIKDIGIH